MAYRFLCRRGAIFIFRKKGLSGGNGAGKSTTMAAFVTALIPDLTL
ncbi:hypothetical protein DIC67_27100, partial [Klebsiella pneumoniae]